MDPKAEVRRSIEFSGDPSQDIEKDPGRLREEAISSKRLEDPGQLARNATGKRNPGKPRSGSDSNASRRTWGH
jgi:hypothetical protein